MVVINDNKVTNKVQIVANQFYMENKIVICNFVAKPESVVESVKKVELKEITGVAKILAEMIKLNNNSLVFE